MKNCGGRLKMLAAMRGTTLKAIIEELLRREIEAEEILKDETNSFGGRYQHSNEEEDGGETSIHDN